jgi:hypothetical protein
MSLDHKYSTATSSNLFLDRSGSENEAEPRYLRKISDYYKKMGMISEQKLPLHRNIYGGIEKALLSSNFHLAENEFPDVVNSKFLGAKEQTDAAAEVEKFLARFFRSEKIPIDVDVVSIDETSVKDPSKLQTNENPNQFVVSAQMAMKSKGKGVLILFAVVSEKDFDPNLINVNKVVSNISSMIRHELMHDRQYDSLARDMGITRAEAKKKFEDWGLIPKEGAPREDYLGSHIEIDAFGHEFAERLAHEFGLERAEQMTATQNITDMRRVAQDIGLADNFREYYEEYPEEKFTNRLQKKIRKNLRAFRAEGIYEVKMKITKRQIRRIVKEAMAPNIPDVVGTVTGVYGEKNRHLADRLNKVWDVVRADTLDALGGQATWEEIADEVLAWVFYRSRLNRID